MDEKDLEEVIRQMQPADPQLLEKLYKYGGTGRALTHEELDLISQREAAEIAERRRLRKEAEEREKGKQG